MAKTTITSGITLKGNFTDVSFEFTSSEDIPDELVFCPGCGEELGQRPHLFVEDVMRSLADEADPGGPICVQNERGQPIEIGPLPRYLYLCAECTERWSEA
jgi:hypothetical protein